MKENLGVYYTREQVKKAFDIILNGPLDQFEWNNKISLANLIGSLVWKLEDQRDRKSKGLAILSNLLNAKNYVVHPITQPFKEAPKRPEMWANELEKVNYHEEYHRTKNQKLREMQRYLIETYEEKEGD